MAHSLMPRDRCFEQLRALTADDHFLARFALLAACTKLDLNQLNDLLYEVEMGDALHHPNAVARVRELLDERFGQ